MLHCIYNAWTEAVVQRNHWSKSLARIEIVQSECDIRSSVAHYMFQLFIIMDFCGIPPNWENNFPALCRFHWIWDAEITLHLAEPIKIPVMNIIILLSTIKERNVFNWWNNVRFWPCQNQFLNFWIIPGVFKHHCLMVPAIKSRGLVKCTGFLYIGRNMAR